MPENSPDLGAGLSDRKRQLLAQLVAGKASLPRPARQAIERLSTAGPLPLSEAQQRLVFVELLYPGNAFNGSLILEHSGRLDLDRLRGAFTAVVLRHDVLRTNALLTEDGPVGVVRHDVEPEFRYMDLAAYKPIEQRVAILSHASEAVARPINIFETCPLINLTTLRIAEHRHIVVLAMHMFAFDAPSGIILVRELAQAYERLGRGVPPFDAPMAYQYADYVAWSAAREATGQIRTKDHWVGRLGGGADVQPLPTDRARRPGWGFEARRQPFTLDKPMAEALKAIARKAGVSLYVVLLGALQTLLYRHSGRASVSVGAWTVRRNPDNSNLIGPFVNPLVYKSSFRDTDRFVDVLERLKSVAAAASAHADLPFEQTVAAVQPVRDINVNPLYQVHFILQETSADAIGEFSLSAFDAEIGAAGGYDIELVVRDLARGLEGHFECNSALFDDGAAAQLSRRFQCLLRAVTADPSAMVGDVLLEDPPRPTSQPSPPYVPTLEAMLEKLDLAPPGACAAICEGREVSYGQFRDLVSIYEAWIDTCAPDCTIVIVGERGAEAAAAMVAVLRRGRAFANLSSASVPVLRRLSGGAALAIIFTDAALHEADAMADAWPYTSRRALGGTAARSRLAPVKASAMRPAYLAATSGTTGPPRFAAISRAGLADVVHALGKEYGLSEGERVLQIAPPDFDVAIEEALPTLLAGGVLVFASEWPSRGLEGLTVDLRDRGVTFANLSGSLWQAWFEHLRQTNDAPPLSLKTVVVGSEPVDIAAVRTWQDSYGHRVALIHAYGAAEAGITCCLYRVPSDRATLAALPRLPIGYPLGGFQVVVKDRQGRRVPPGVAGELHIAGAAVADGYLGGEIDGNQRFRDGWFCSGDLGRVRGDGALDLLGRRESKCKIAGRWIDLEAAHAAFAQAPGVLAVELTPSGRGMDVRLDVRIWPKRAILQEAGIAQQLRAAIERVAADLSGVPLGAVEILGVADAGTPEGPQISDGPLAAKLSELWTHMLGGRRLDSGRSVFEQGVVSLDCLRLVARARSLGLSIADIYEHQSINAQAALLARRAPGGIS